MSGIEGEWVKAKREVANVADKNAMGWRFLRELDRVLAFSVTKVRRNSGRKSN